MSADEQPRDHAEVPEETASADSELEQNIKSRSTWVRLIFMLAISLVYAVSRPVVFAVIVTQFLWVLFSGDTNKQLARFGHSLALYTCEIIDFMTYNSEAKPFPFDTDWPSGD
ncbi:MAG: DUF4389 domain-containing protein [Gammaproteobacteria bacterium]|nr:DUF4389 domain-containing protein [Gammaproteobacteria bacterium]